MTDYDTYASILTDALEALKEAGISRGDVLPTLLDFTGSIAFAMAGEEGLKACILRFGQQIEDHRKGISHCEQTDAPIWKNLRPLTALDFPPQAKSFILPRWRPQLALTRRSRGNAGVSR